jgi:hypothetical protein
MRRPQDVWGVFKNPLPWLAIWVVLAACAIFHLPYVLVGVIVTLFILSAVVK